MRNKYEKVKIKGNVRSLRVWLLGFTPKERIYFRSSEQMIVELISRNNCFDIRFQIGNVEASCDIKRMRCKNIERY